MTPTNPSRLRWLVPLRWFLLTLAVLASGAIVVVFGFAVTLFVSGYSGGNDPQSISALAFPLSFIVMIVVGVPTAFVCALAWLGYGSTTQTVACLRNSPGHRYRS